MSRIVTLIFLSVMGISAQVLLKKGVDRLGPFRLFEIGKHWNHLLFNGYMLAAATLYLIVFITYLSLLSRNYLSLLYPLSVGIGFVTMMIFSTLFLQEGISLPKIIGLALIVCGILILNVTKA